jgi:hypothetical protein
MVGVWRPLDAELGFLRDTYLRESQKVLCAVAGSGRRAPPEAHRQPTSAGLALPA